VVTENAAYADQPISTLMYFKFLVEPPAAVYHLPERPWSDASPTASHGDVPARHPTGGAGRLTAELQSHGRVGSIVVTRVGADSPAAIEQARAALCVAAERLGFFFSSMDPRPACEGDVLQLQFVAVPFDPAALHVEEPFAQEIVAYVLAQRRGAPH